MNELRNQVQKVIGNLQMSYALAEELSPKLAREIKSYDPLQMALILKDVYNMDARGIAFALKDCECSHKAVRIGQVILNEQVYPDTEEKKMRDILKDAFPEEDTDQAIAILYPQVFEVDACEIWADTHADICSDERVEITYLSGKWSVLPWGESYDASGTSVIAKEGYALPGVGEGCLIGKLGKDGEPFAIGREYSFEGKKGRLYLIANDDIDKKYGGGYTDNKGAVTVKITRELV